ncbi:MAG: hypothetical protein ACRYGR_06675 [Janthinobacterium lividum]
MTGIKADLTTILGAGLMAGAIVLWMLGRIALADLAGAATIAGFWIGLQEVRSPSTSNTTTSITNKISASTAVINPAAPEVIEEKP